jgi:hypothetical protein
MVLREKNLSGCQYFRHEIQADWPGTEHRVPSGKPMSRSYVTVSKHPVVGDRPPTRSLSLGIKKVKVGDAYRGRILKM